MEFPLLVGRYPYSPLFLNMYISLPLSRRGDLCMGCGWNEVGRRGGVYSELKKGTKKPLPFLGEEIRLCQGRVSKMETSRQKNQP